MPLSAALRRKIAACTKLSLYSLSNLRRTDRTLLHLTRQEIVLDFFAQWLSYNPELQLWAGRPSTRVAILFMSIRLILVGGSVHTAEHSPNTTEALFMVSFLSPSLSLSVCVCHSVCVCRSPPLFLCASGLSLLSMSLSRYPFHPKTCLEEKFAVSRSRFSRKRPLTLSLLS